MFEAIRPALVIARREVRDQFRDWRVIFPILFLTILFPFIMNFTARQILDFAATYGANIVGERMVPFLLMIVGFFPISVSLVIALETFVGEKERGSIEPLLSSPIKDWQLYLGKLISATIPPLVGSFLGMGVYLGGLLLSQVALPEPAILIQILVLTIVQAVMMVSGAVVVSSQATSVRAANLLASFIIIPVAFLIQGESVVMFWGHETLSLWWIVLGITLLAILLVRVGLAHFQREELLGKEIDVLNIRWMVRSFWGEFKAGARNIPQWYKRAVFQSVKDMRWAILAVAVFTVVSVWLGAGQTKVFPLQIDAASMDERLEKALEYLPMHSSAPVLMIFWQNVRVQILGLIMGMFSFGILGMMPIFATFGVVGYLVKTLELSGLPAGTTLAAFILPHGILELPALILSAAAVLYLGALLATPVRGKTVGEVFISGLAGWFRIVIGLVIPLLLLAALIEAWVTPRIALYFLR